MSILDDAVPGDGHYLHASCSECGRPYMAPKRCCTCLECREAAKKERIVSVAVRYEGDHSVTFALARPNRHHHIFWDADFQEKIRKLHPASLEIQGFMTSTGRFVDRELGLKIATEANQIIKKHPSYDKLFSEDMW